MVVAAWSAALLRVQRPCQDDGRRGVGAPHALHRRGREAGHIVELKGRSVVHHRVDAAELLLHGRHKGFTEVFVGEVGAKGVGPGTQRHQAFHRFCGSGRGVAKVHCHIPAGRGQRGGDDEADALRAAGDKDNGAVWHGAKVLSVLEAS
jgi:hypothetical protein